MNVAKMVAILTVGGAALACGQTTTERLKLPEPSTVERVDLERYAGKWYEIARLPNRFQKNCAATTATYTLRNDGGVDVLNACNRDNPGGKLRTVKGRARVVDAKTNSKLEVSFFRPFYGDYWIVDLDRDYQWAVVASPSRDYLWLLSRAPHMDPALYGRLVAQLRDKGFEVDRLLVTDHG